MTFVPMTVATTAATAAAARHAQMLIKEEESMTPYSSDETEGWEFKIVRSSTAKFKLPDVVRKLVEEEARSGWELLEKFDDSRIRFKRRITHRADDVHRDLDPYRTQVGWSPDRLGLTIVAAILALAGLVALAVFLLAS